jgi:DNA-binding NarL/FixJ family response regulator
VTPQLTPTEVKVLVLLAEGEGREDVAGRLGVSVNTVKHHAENVYAKLGTGGLIRTYRELGWLRVPQS